MYVKVNGTLISIRNSVHRQKTKNVKLINKKQKLVHLVLIFNVYVQKFSWALNIILCY